MSDKFGIAKVDVKLADEGDTNVSSMNITRNKKKIKQSITKTNLSDCD